MSVYVLLTLLVLLGPPLRKVVYSLLLQRKKTYKNDKCETRQAAEIDGGVWERTSVFDHIERGLKRNPEGLALVCLFQPPDHLRSLGISSLKNENETYVTSKAENPVGNKGLWHKKSQQHHDTGLPDTVNKMHRHQNGQVNGQVNRQMNGHQDSTLETKEEENEQCPSTTLPTSKPNGIPTSTQSPVAVSSGCLTVTYTQLHNTATHIAAGLLTNGISANTTMVMLIPNGGEFALLLYTCVLLRITYVFLDPNLLDISGFTMLKHFLRTLKPQIVVAPDLATGRALDVAVTELQLPPPMFISLSDTSSNSKWKSLASVTAAGMMGIAKGLVNEASLTNAARNDSAARIHSIMFTSGTSGLPKGCPLRVGGMSNALQSQAWLLENGGDELGLRSSSHSPVRALMQPHNSRGIAPAQTLQTWRSGGSVILTGHSFDIKAAISAITRARATFIVLTPPMVHEMAQALSDRPDINVDCVRTIQVGGDTVTRGLLESCEKLFPHARVLVNHGMTEGPGAFMWPSHFSRSSVSQLPFYGEFVCPVGSVAPGATVRICDVEKGRGIVLARGELGEMHVSCPSIIGHYWNGRSDESFYSDAVGKRWFNTGDAAIINNDGVIFVIGRVKDIIRRAGVPIMPAPLESLIEGFTGAQTIVVPAPHHVLGAEPFAVVRTYNGKSERDIKERVRAVFGKHCSLGGVVSLKQLGLVEFPLNATHKVVKAEVLTAVKSYIGALPGRRNTAEVLFHDNSSMPSGTR